MKKRIPEIVFVITLIIICFFNDYQKTSFLPPVSIHAWRQADGASFALNYAKDGMDFFNPELHNFSSDDKTSGAGVSEAPIIYYFVAILYQLFGVHESIFRITDLLIILISVFLLFQQLYIVLKNPFLAAFAALMPFSSAVFSYYANGFIPDYTSLSFMILAAVQFLIYQEHNRNRNLFLLFLFAILSGLLKITNLCPFIALNFVFIIVCIFPKYKKTFAKKFLWIIGFSTSYAIIIGWYVFAIHYNKNHESSYFANEIHSAFQYSWPSFTKTLNDIWNQWHEPWFHRWIYYLIPVAFLFSLSLIKRMTLFFIYVLTLTAGTAIYFILWFEKFINHDYYIAPFFSLFTVIVVGFFLSIKSWLPKVYTNWIIGLSLLLLLAYPIAKASSLNRHRYDAGYFFDDYESYKTIGKLMKEKGIDRNTKIISNEDFTYAVSLYLTDFKGWTHCQYPLNPVNTVKLIEKGASFLLLKGDESVKKYPLQQILQNKFITYKDLYFYDLRQCKLSMNNFDFDTISCNIETEGFNGTVATTNPLIFAGNAPCRTNERSHSGNYSMKLNSIESFALTSTIPNIYPGDSLIFHLWRFGDQNYGSFVIHDLKNQAKWDMPLKTNAPSDVWSFFEIRLLMPDNFLQGDLFLYFYNPSKTPIYIDDFEIIKINKNKTERLD